MRKIKICKKLTKLLHIDYNEHDCNCLDMEEFVAVNDLTDLILSPQWGDLELRVELTRQLSPKQEAKKDGIKITERK